jgi:stage II sporulation protein D
MRRRLPPLLALTAVLLVPTPAAAATRYTLVGHGFGHGIGMSQYGALGLAEHGWDHARILAHYYRGTTLGSVRAPARERVLLLDARPALRLTVESAATLTGADGAATTLAPGAVRVLPGRSAASIRLVDGAGVDVATALAPATLAPSAPLRIDDAVGGWTGAHWPGSFSVDRSQAGLRLVAGVALETYVRGVVPSEMPSSWAALPGGAEALRTQAVAARSYALATRHPSADFDAYSDTRSQVFGPIEHRAPASDAAVATTAGQVVRYGGAVATTFFSSSSGGRTASMQAAWGSSSGQPYLVPVDDPYDAAGGANPYHTWAPRAFSPRSLAAALGLAGEVGAAEVQVDPDSRRALRLTAHGPGGATVLSAGRVYAALGLRSTFFQLIQLSLRAPAQTSAGARVLLRGRTWPLRGRPHLEADRGSGWLALSMPVRPDTDGRFEVAVHPSVTMRYRLVRRNAEPVVVAVSVRP